MERHLRIQSYWSQLAIFVMLFGVFFLVFGFIQYGLYTAYDIGLKPDLKNPRVLTVVKWAQGASSVMVFLLPAFAAILLSYKGRYAYFMGFKKADKANMYVLSALVVLLSLPFVFWLGQINQQIPLPSWMKQLEQDAAQQMSAFLKVNSSFDIIINLIIIALLPAIGEELCFRAVLQRIIIGITKNAWAGIIITGFLFSALHLQFEGFIPRMFLGILLGALYWFSGSLWTSILAHFVFNGIQVLVVSYAPVYASQSPSPNFLLSIVSGLAVFAILYFYTRQSTINYEKVYETEALNQHNQFIA